MSLSVVMCGVVRQKNKYGHKLNVPRLGLVFQLEEVYGINIEWHTR